jgi:hypothetical protein
MKTRRLFGVWMVSRRKILVPYRKWVGADRSPADLKTWEHFIGIDSV